MVNFLPPEEQLSIIKEKTVDIISEEELLNKLKQSFSEKKPLRIKYGADPSAPDIHLGHTVVLKKLRVFQELGHKIIFIIGDFTAMIGDPTGRSKTRKPLSKEQVEENAKTYKNQIFKILDEARTEVVYNSQWLEKMKFSDVLNLSSRYTVARMLERDDFSKRFKEGHAITILEFLYPLIQGYDSVYLKSDVELGGTDQTFNMLVGRDLQRDFGLDPQIVISMPILEGLDGKMKMSKSYGNYIGVNENPIDIYGKVMSVSDELMFRYLELLTNIKLEELNKLKKEVAEGKVHPMDVKKKLAFDITKEFAGDENAEKAKTYFEKVVSGKQLPESINVLEYDKDKVWIVDILKDAGFVKSSGEAKRLIRQGAVKIDGAKMLDEHKEVEIKNEMIIKCGKRNYIKIKKI